MQNSDDVGDFTVVDFNNDQDIVDVDLSSETQEFTLVDIETDDAGEPLVSPNIDLTSGCNTDGLISMPSPGKELPHREVSDIVSLDQHTDKTIVDPGILELAESINNSQKSTQPKKSEEPVFKSPRSFTDAEIVSEAMLNYKRKMKNNDQKSAEVSTNKKVDCAETSTNKDEEEDSPSGNIIPESTAAKLKESVMDNSADLQVKSQKPAAPTQGKTHKSELKHKTGPGITMIICNVEKAKPPTSEKPLYLEMKIQDKVLTPTQGTLGGNFASTEMIDLTNKKSDRMNDGQAVFKLTKKGLVDRRTCRKSMIKEKIKELLRQNSVCEIVEDKLSSIVQCGRTPTHRNYNLGIMYLKHRNEAAEFGSMIQDITVTEPPGDCGGVKAPIQINKQPLVKTSEQTSEQTTKPAPSKTMQALRALLDSRKDNNNKK